MKFEGKWSAHPGCIAVIDSQLFVGQGAETCHQEQSLLQSNILDRSSPLAEDCLALFCHEGLLRSRHFLQLSHSLATFQPQENRFWASACARGGAV